MLKPITLDNFSTYSYMLIFHNILYFYHLMVTFENIYICILENEDDIFLFFRNVRKSSASEILFKEQNLATLGHKNMDGLTYFNDNIRLESPNP